MHGDGQRDGKLKLGGKLECEHHSGRELDRRHNFEQRALHRAGHGPQPEHSDRDGYVGPGFHQGRQHHGYRYGTVVNHHFGFRLL